MQVGDNGWLVSALSLHTCKVSGLYANDQIANTCGTDMHDIAGSGYLLMQGIVSSVACDFQRSGLGGGAGSGHETPVLHLTPLVPSLLLCGCEPVTNPQVAVMSHRAFARVNSGNTLFGRGAGVNQ